MKRSSAALLLALSNAAEFIKCRSPCLSTSDDRTGDCARSTDTRNNKVVDPMDLPDEIAGDHLWGRRRPAP